MQLYQKFRNSSLDLSPLGLEVGAQHSNHIYTPSGARILAWLTDDRNVHFCQVERLGNTVFAVNPAAPPGDCIHPVAHSICDFIALLVRCKSASLIANAYRWGNNRFTELTEVQKLGAKARSVIRALENLYHPPVIQDPYSYMLGLQQRFHYPSIPLHPDYFEWCPIRPGTPKWEVGFGTGFADYCEKGQAGKELPVNRSFIWNEENWCVPAVYLCESGIIVDSYQEVDAPKIQTHMAKWANRNEDSMSVEDKMNRLLEDPLHLDAVGVLFVNEKEFRVKKSFIETWNPYLDNTWQMRRVLEHYQLDRSKGYLFRRECFLRKGKYPPIRTIQLTMSATPVPVPGQRFTTAGAGDKIRFTHPESGKEHILTVISQSREALDPNFLSNHPCCYTKLVYSLDPPLNTDAFRIADCDPGDNWDQRPEDPTTLIIPGKKPPVGNFALSSLRYIPAQQIYWRMIFRRKLRCNTQVRLLP